MVLVPSTVQTRRFAKAALNIYERERRFAIDRPTANDLDATAQAFVELGCTVVVDRRKGVLTVTCGQSS